MDIFDVNRWDFPLYGYQSSSSAISYLDVLLSLKDGQTCSRAYFQRRYGLSRIDSTRLIFRLNSDEMIVLQSRKNMYYFNNQKEKDVLEMMFKLYEYDKEPLLNNLFEFLALVKTPFSLFTFMKKLKQKGITRNSSMLEKLSLCGVLSTWYDDEKGNLYFPDKIPLHELKSKLFEYSLLKESINTP